MVSARTSIGILLCLGLADLLVHLAGSGRYGFFRDELYYIACGDHLAAGYVDQPPLIALIARCSGLILGTSLVAYRILPAIASGVVVIGTGLLARELGGGPFTWWFAGLVMLVAPLHLAFGSFLSMNAFEPFFWSVCIWIFLRILATGNQRLWLAFGLVCGVALLNKHTTLAFGLAFVIALLLTKHRAQLGRRWIWLAGLITLVVFLPNLVWEARNNWAQVEVVRNAQMFKNTPIGALTFLAEQAIFLNPLTVPLLLAGLAWLFFSNSGSRFRILGWTFVIFLAIVIALNGKSYYPLPIYPSVLAAGAVALESVLLAPRRTWLRHGWVAILVISAVIMLPYVIPVLPVETFIAWDRLLNFSPAVKTERDQFGNLHQLYADMFGWDNIAQTVSEVWHSLPEEDRRKCAILAGNYGEAGAIDLLGRGYGLPRAISGHNNYFLWGPRDYTGEVVILFGEHAETIRTMFSEVTEVARISSKYAAPTEIMLPVYLCRHSKAPLRDLWPAFRFYI